MNPRHIAMGAALLVAGGLVVFGDNRPDSGVAEAVERAPAAVTVVAASPRSDAPKAPVAEVAIMPLVPRALLIGDGDEAMGRGADVFGQQNWAPPPPPPPTAAEQQQRAAPPPPPMAPPLPFTYLGKAAADGRWEVYLAIGDKTYVVRDKMVIDGAYRVDAIAPPNLTLTYLPLNQVQQLNIGVLD